MSRPSWVEYLEDWVGAAATDVLRRRYAALCAQGVKTATAAFQKHDYRPHEEYPWFCADCGYAPHESWHNPWPQPDARGASGAQEVARG